MKLIYRIAGSLRILFGRIMGIALLFSVANATAAEPGNPGESSTVLGIQENRFTLNGRPAFLLGISYYGALGASDEFIRRDLDDIQRSGFKWLRVWATWSAFEKDVSAVDVHGSPHEPFLGKLRSLVAQCDARGMIIDVTLTRNQGATAGGLPDFAAHERAVQTLIEALKPHRNWYLDLANERDVRDARYVSVAELKRLRDLARRLDPQLPVTASFGGHDLTEEDVRDALVTAGLDFLAPHRPREASSPAQTEAQTRNCLGLAKGLAHPAPIHYQEPFRRGYAGWEPSAKDFLDDLRGALAGGAAGWCFHNGSSRATPDNQPRRSFDLRARRLFEQLDPEEHKVVAAARDVLANARTGAEAIPVSEFLNSLGVCSAVSRRGETLARTIETAAYLGLRWFRVGYESGIPVPDLLKLHQETGVRFSYGLMSGGTDIARLLEGARQLAQAGALLAFEGNNEPNNWGITYEGQRGGRTNSWLPVAKLQRDLYRAAKGDPVLKDYPVWNLSESGAESDNVGVQFLTIPAGAGVLMPDGTRFADYANCHNYLTHPGWPGLHDNQTWVASDPTSACRVDGLYGNYGSTWARHYPGYTQVQLLSLPRVTTETGVTIDGKITEELQGLLYLGVYLDQFKRGWKHTSIYLLRDRTDEAGNQTFGFYKPDYSPRLAATYLHNLTTILADKGSGTPRGDVDYSISNQPATVHDLLLQKSDGTFELVVWAERFTGGSDAITIQLNPAPPSVTLFDPTIGTSPVRTFTNTGSISLTLSNHPVVLQLPGADKTHTGSQTSAAPHTGAPAAGDRGTGILPVNPFRHPPFHVPRLWEYSRPLISPEPRPTNASRAQKDPTVVFHDGKWHVFMTVKLPGRSAIEYCSFSDWDRADASPRAVLDVSDSDYCCAPQVFYFRPHRKWYLVYQVGVPGRDKMWVAYSTTSDIADPRSWTRARPILDGSKEDPRKEGGLDYWVICDDQRAYLFLTSLNGKMWRLWTPLEQFPAGFAHCELALQAKVFEASHTYRLKGSNKYLTIIEEDGRRYYKAYVADRLDGDWSSVADTAERPFAGWNNIRPGPGVEPWTDNISHGELIRDGSDETLTVDPANLRFVFQGMLDAHKSGKGYGQFQWRIGLLTPVVDSRDTSGSR